MLREPWIWGQDERAAQVVPDLYDSKLSSFHLNFFSSDLLKASIISFDFIIGQLCHDRLQPNNHQLWQNP